MLTQREALQLAREWIDAWNSRDVDLILTHYADDAELHSPMVERIAGAAGAIRGKPALKKYFTDAFVEFPDLQFEMFQVFTGVSSFVIYYRSVRGLLAAEMMVVNGERKIERVFAHYREET